MRSSSGRPAYGATSRPRNQRQSIHVDNRHRHQGREQAIHTSAEQLAGGYPRSRVKRRYVLVIESDAEEGPRLDLCL